jgi:U32 family peptidase
VAGGADAVYLGVGRFSARARAQNFDLEFLAHHVDYLHSHGLRCYVTLNTLLRDLELPAAVATAVAVAGAGADAVILQDLGLWRVIRRELPDLEMHVSTQMTVHTPEQIEVLADLGARRIILARELSLGELERCTQTAHRRGIEVECFVHGALCYAFSGQCSMSALGTGRSANRGACEQCCRFDFDDGHRRGPLLSLSDLNLLDHIPELAAAGVSCLKIEGRLKGPEYVYTVCQAYRAALDAWEMEETLDSAPWQRRLREVFARPFTTGPITGELGESCRVIETGLRRTESDARLLRVSRSKGTAELASNQEIRAGQGFAYVLEDGGEGGFLITNARRDGSELWHCAIRIAARGPHLPENLALRRNTDQQRDAENRRIMARFAVPPPRSSAVSLDIEVVTRLGHPLGLRVRSADGRFAEVDGPVVERARQQPLDESLLQRTVGALGGSGFRLGQWTLQLDPEVFVPASTLKSLRRELVENLAAQPVPSPERWQLPDPRQRSWSPILVAVAANVPMARSLLAAGADQVWLDDPNLDLWREDPPRLEATFPGLWLRHPSTAPVSPHLQTLGMPVVAGHLGVLRAAVEAGLEVVADVGLNMANYATADALAELGAKAAVASLEINSEQIHDLVTRSKLPCYAIAAGRRLLMSSRQDHGLAAGNRRPLTVVQDQHPYTIERHIAGLTLIREAQDLDQLRSFGTALPGLAGFVLETGTMPEEHSLALVSSALKTLGDDGSRWLQP